MATIDDAVFACVLEDVAAGVAVRTSIRSHKLDTKGFYKLLASSEEHRERYRTAKRTACEAIVDECYHIADKCRVSKDAVAKARLQIDIRKWHLAHLEPKRYGERTVLAGDPDNPLAFVDADAATVRSKLLSGIAAAGAAAPPGEPE